MRRIYGQQLYDRSGLSVTPLAAVSSCSKEQEDTAASGARPVRAHCAESSHAAWCDS
jgi:hypothetical protein